MGSEHARAVRLVDPTFQGRGASVGCRCVGAACLAHSGQHAASGTRGGVPAVVPGSAAARGAYRGLTPSVWCAPNGGLVRGLCTRLQPLLDRREELKVHVGSCAGLRLVRGDQRVQFGLDHLLQLPDSVQVGVFPFLRLPVKNLLAIQVHFKSAVRARGERNPYIWPKAAKEFVRQPRGGRVELSRHTVQDIHQYFPLAIGRHGSPPDVPGTT
jgi:hypothetical protein